MRCSEAKGSTSSSDAASPLASGTALAGSTHLMLMSASYTHTMLPLPPWWIKGRLPLPSFCAAGTSESTATLSRSQSSDLACRSCFRCAAMMLDCGVPASLGTCNAPLMLGFSSLALGPHSPPSLPPFSLCNPQTRAVYLALGHFFE